MDSIRKLLFFHLCSVVHVYARVGLNVRSYDECEPLCNSNSNITKVCVDTDEMWVTLNSHRELCAKLSCEV